MSDPFATEPLPADPMPDAADTSEQDQNQRQLLIEKYRQVSLRQPDLVRANLGVLGGELMELLAELKRTIDSQLTSAGDSGSLGEELYRTIDTYLRVHRQLERYLQLDVRLSGAAARRR